MVKAKRVKSVDSQLIWRSNRSTLMVGLLSGFDPSPPTAMDVQHPGMDLLTCGLVGQGRGCPTAPDSKIARVEE